MKARKPALLVVDDDENQRLLIEKTFKSLLTTYRIHFASSGNEALEYLKGEGKYGDRSRFEFPSYIITDLQMPNGDGFAILDFLKQHPALSVIPVVMLSTSDDEDDIRQAYLLGASSYFVKPHGIPDLKALLKDIHDYWIKCEVPQVDIEGYALPTKSHGRPGARFTKPMRRNK